MQEESIRSSLEELHAELLSITPEDEAMREKLDGLTDYVHSLLEQPDLSGSRLSLEEHLEEQLISFEASYPKTSQLISDIGVMLSSIGI